MTKLLPWVICFDVTMPQEVFNLLHEGVISYGLDVLELAWFSDNNIHKYEKNVCFVQ